MKMNKATIIMGKVATGSTATVKEWIQFSSKLENEKQVVLAALRGGSHMYRQVQECILVDQVAPWMGFFSRFYILLAVSGLFLDGRSLWFEVQNDGRLTLPGENDWEIMTRGSLQQVKIAAHDVKR